MSVQLESLHKVFVTQLKDIYSAENQLLKAIPKMAEAATNQKLQQAFTSHLEETREHISRLDQIFSTLEYKPGGHRCKAMAGLIEEGEEVIKEEGKPEARDAALICAAQKVEHYEIATYGTLRAYAQVLGLDQAYKSLTKTLEEERGTDTKLTDLAEGTINKLAMQSMS